MRWVVADIHRIMIPVWSPDDDDDLRSARTDAALRSTFGEGVSGPVADIVVRNWGELIALVGATPIYGARKPAVRPWP